MTRALAALELKLGTSEVLLEGVGSGCVMAAVLPPEVGDDVVELLACQVQGGLGMKAPGLESGE